MLQAAETMHTESKISFLHHQQDWKLSLFWHWQDLALINYIIFVTNSKHTSRYFKDNLIIIKTLIKLQSDKAINTDCINTEQLRNYILVNIFSKKDKVFFLSKTAQKIKNLITWSETSSKHVHVITKMWIVGTDACCIPVTLWCSMTALIQIFQFILKEVC